MKAFNNLKEKFLVLKMDVADIKRKLYVKRNGWVELALFFNISDEIVLAEKEEDKKGELPSGFR